MKYERQEINVGSFDGILPDGCKVYRTPELPTISFVKGGVTYSVTDMRFLNERAVDAVEKILAMACSDPDLKEVSFDVTGIEEDTIDLISDIICAIKVHAHKGGKNGYDFDAWMIAVDEHHVHEEEGHTILTFRLGGSCAKAMYKYAHKQESTDISYYDLAAAVANATIKAFGLQP